MTRSFHVSEYLEQPPIRLQSFRGSATSVVAGVSTASSVGLLTFPKTII